MTIQIAKTESNVLWEPDRSETPGNPFARSRIQSVMPLEPGSVVKIFHGIYERPGVAADGQTWDDCEEEGPARSPAVEKVLKGSTLVYFSAGSDDAVGRRVRWKELVHSLRMVWHAEVNVRSITRANGGSWPAHVWGPEEGNLDTEQLRALVRVLLEAGATRDAVATHPFWRCEPMERWRWSFDLAELEAVREHRVNKYADGPAEVMATDRSWYLRQDIDTAFTLLSASEDVMRRILAEPVLEAVRASPTDRVDYKADEVNERRRTNQQRVSLDDGADGPE